MGKAPAFLFYPADWLRDADLARCSLGAQGAWIRMICLLHNCEEYGVFASGGKPWPVEDVAGAVGGDKDAALACVSELLSKGVAQRDNRGAVFCRRMVEDEQDRAKDRERKRTERSVQGLSGPSPPAVRDLSKPSSSASSSSDKSERGDAAAREVPTDEIEREAVWNALDAWAIADPSRRGRSISTAHGEHTPVLMAVGAWSGQSALPGGIGWSVGAIRCIKTARAAGTKFGDSPRYAIKVINGMLAAWREGTPPEPAASIQRAGPGLVDDGAMQRGLALAQRREDERKAKKARTA